MLATIIAEASDATASSRALVGYPSVGRLLCSLLCNSPTPRRTPSSEGSRDGHAESHSFRGRSTCADAPTIGHERAASAGLAARHRQQSRSGLRHFEVLSLVGGRILPRSIGAVSPSSCRLPCPVPGVLRSWRRLAGDTPRSCRRCSARLGGGFLLPASLAPRAPGLPMSAVMRPWSPWRREAALDPAKLDWALSRYGSSGARRLTNPGRRSPPRSASGRQTRRLRAMP